MIRESSVSTVKQLIVMLMAIAMTSCAATVVGPAVSKNIGTYPPIGSKAIAEVGEVIAEQFEYDAYINARLDEPLQAERALGKVDVPAGIVLKGRVDEENNFQFCSDKKYYHDPLVGPYGVVCFADTDDDGRFDRFRVPNIMLGAWKDLEHSLRYELQVTDMPEDSGRGYKLQLIYQGLDEGDIRIAYREYVNNMARPAFSQIVEYPYTTGEIEIAFKGARITVHEATPNQMSYTLTKRFSR